MYGHNRAGTIRDGCFMPKIQDVLIRVIYSGREGSESGGKSLKSLFGYSLYPVANSYSL